MQQCSYGWVPLETVLLQYFVFPRQFVSSPVNSIRANYRSRVAARDNEQQCDWMNLTTSRRTGSEVFTVRSAL
jgi:hypothetical protein